LYSDESKPYFSGCSHVIRNKTFKIQFSGTIDGRNLRLIYNVIGFKVTFIFYILPASLGGSRLDRCSGLLGVLNLSSVNNAHRYSYYNNNLAGTMDKVQKSIHSSHKNVKKTNVHTPSDQFNLINFKLLSGFYFWLGEHTFEFKSPSTWIAITYNPVFERATRKKGCVSVDWCTYAL